MPFYILFKCKDPLKSLAMLNICIFDIIVWMIENKFNFNQAHLSMDITLKNNTDVWIFLVQKYDSDIKIHPFAFMIIHF